MKYVLFIAACILSTFIGMYSGSHLGRKGVVDIADGGNRVWFSFHDGNFVCLEYKNGNQYYWPSGEELPTIP